MKKVGDNLGVFPSVSVAGIVPREALMRKMTASGKNIFLSAPGGYGKSVAAAQWLFSVRGKTARLLAGDADNEPGFYYKRLAAVLMKLTGTKGIPDTFISFDRLLEIIRLLPKKRPRCYLVLDDLHMIKNEEIIKNMPLIATSLPDYIRRCLVSRSEPAASVLESGLFTLFTKDALLFSPEEVEWLGAEKNYSLTDEQIKDLLKITGGWAMYLSALLSGSESLDTMKGKTPQTLTQYLDARVWKLWDHETKILLLSLAIPTEVTPDLCERLTGQTDGRGVLERLTKMENAFLIPEDVDTFRFHDIFHNFLLERMDSFFDKDKIRRLNEISAEWYYEQGNYYTGAKYYIYNNDYEGINRCMEATNRFHAEAGNISVEARLNFVKQHVLNLSSEFVSKSPYLISKCAVVAYHDGDAGLFLRYLDSLYTKASEVSSKYPQLFENFKFISSLDFRVPLKQCAQKTAKTMPAVRRASGEAKSVTITQNLPFFHRSMRDFAEYHDLNEDELALLRNTYGAMIGKDYAAMEPALIAGIYYERGELMEAAHHALIGYRACGDDMHPETVFCAQMTLSTVLYAMGASQEASSLMEGMGHLIERKALFLRSNFKALQTERALRDGNAEAAREWLAVYANRSNHLPFYQISRHFATLRSHMALKNYQAAVMFGTRLHTLAAEYKRPLDQIESGLLIAVALWRGGEKNKAVKQLEQAVHAAMPYGFIQLFINEGKEALPLLWELKRRAGKAVGFMRFVDRLTDTIYKKHNLKPAGEVMPKLSEQQRSMLAYLSKGMTYNEIADATGLGRGTVKSHILLVYKRLGASNAQEAALKAKMLGLLK